MSLFGLIAKILERIRMSELLDKLEQEIITVDNLVRIESDDLAKLVGVARAAKFHADAAKAHHGGGACFAWCPNNDNGDNDCECGGSMIYSALRALEGGE